MSTKLKAQRKQKREEAEGRQAAWTLLSPESKLSSLNLRPGASTKERARIMKHIEMSKALKASEKKG